MKKLFFTFAMLVTVINKAVEETPKPFVDSFVSILLDDVEPKPEELDDNGNVKEMGAVTNRLYINLLQQASILVVSTSVVKNLTTRLKSNPNPMGLVPAQTGTVEPNKWIKRKVTDYLYVLIPRSYPPLLNNFNKTTKITTKTYTDAELATGIKFEHMTNITDTQFMDPSYHKAKNEYPEATPQQIIGFDYPSKGLSEHFAKQFRVPGQKKIKVPYKKNNKITTKEKTLDIKNRSTIFISRGEYAEQNKGKQTKSWVIFMDGHGSVFVSLDMHITALKKHSQANWNYIKDEIQRLEKLKKEGELAFKGGIIAGLESPGIREFFDFVEQRLNGKFIFLESCFASQVNFDKALKEINKNIEKDYPFIIGTGVIAAGPESGSTDWIESGPRNNPTKKLITKPLFQKFFEELKKPYPDLSQAIKYIYKLYSVGFGNIPMLKYPSKQWQPLIKLPTIDETMALTKTKTLVFPNFFGSKASSKAILIETTSKIPFEIVIKKGPPAWISKVAGNATHHFTKIDARNLKLSEFIDSFFKIDDLRENKTFVIDTLIINNDVNRSGLSTGEKELKNVIIMNIAATELNAPSKKRVFFQYANTGWIANMGPFVENNYYKFKTFTEALEKDSKQSRINTLLEQIKQRSEQPSIFKPTPAAGKINLTKIKQVEKKKIQRGAEFVRQTTEQRKVKISLQNLTNSLAKIAKG